MLDEIVKKTATLNEKGRLTFLNDVFGERGAKAINALISDYASFGSTLKTLERDAAGFNATVSAGLQDTLKGQMSLAMVEFKLTANDAFESSEASFVNFARSVKEFAGSDTFKSWVSGASSELANLLVVLRDNSTTLQALIGVWASLKLVLLAAETAMGAATVAAVGLGRALSLMAGPVGLIAILAAGYLVLRENRDADTEAMRRAVNQGDDLIKSLTDETKKIEDQVAVLRERKRLLADGIDPDRAEIGARKLLEQGKLNERLKEAQAKESDLEARKAKASADSPDFGEARAFGNKKAVKFKQSDLDDARKAIADIKGQIASLPVKYETLAVASINKRDLTEAETYLKRANELVTQLNNAKSAGKKLEAGLFPDIKKMGGMTGPEAKAYYESVKSNAEKALDSYTTPKRGGNGAARRAKSEEDNFDKAVLDGMKKDFAQQAALSDQKYSSDRKKLEAQHRWRLVEDSDFNAALEVMEEKQLKDRLGIENKAKSAIEDYRDKSTNLPRADIQRIKDELELRQENIKKLEETLKLNKELAAINQTGKIHEIKTKGDSTVTKMKGEYEKDDSTRRQTKSLDLLAGADKDAALAAIKEGARWQQEIIKLQSESVNLKGSELEATNMVIDGLRAQKVIHEQMAAAQARKQFEETSSWGYGAEKSWQKYRDSALTNAQVVEQAMTGSFQSMESAFVKFTQTGKTSFKSLVATMLQQIQVLLAKQAIQQILGLVTSAAGAYFGGTPAGTSPSTTSAFGPSAGSNSVGSGTSFMSQPLYHTGGVVGSDNVGSKHVSSSVFNNAHRFHTGGITGSEVPIIAQKGEGVFTEGQMKKMAPVSNGGSTNVVLTVNVDSGGKANKENNNNSQADEFASALEAGVLQIIEREKRPGGSLY